MKDPKNWLVVSVFANAILGGLVISLVTENTGFGTVFLIVFLSAVVITYTVINQKTPEEQKEYEKEVFDYKKQIDNFAAIMGNHKIASNVFVFIEQTTLALILIHFFINSCSEYQESKSIV